ncbi:MAG: hypothetical protein ACRD9L_17415 [Bryobacteraceae bacterium]
MERGIERMIESSGLSLPLAGRIVELIVDSGASRLEVLSALSIVQNLLTTLLAHFAQSQSQR